MTELTALRSARTRAANSVRRTIDHMLTSPAKWDQHGRLVPDGWVGLPSWWPFWSDSLASSVRNLVRLGRRLEALEYHEAREARDTNT